MISFNLDHFIQEEITHRAVSFFDHDIELNKSKLHQNIGESKVLVIGGAGTIGSSFIKALLPFKPESLTVVDYSENGLTELTRDLRSMSIYIPKNYITYPFDFGSKVFEKLIKHNEYDIIACFAAHKHVRSEKDPYAIEAMITNNVFNTQKLLDLIIQKPPKHFFSVSTDKAANPVNVMGASKKLMEAILLSYSKHYKISTARFANVAFSNGSLLDGFISRIAKNQPLSSPTDVKRYFVSPKESGQLCLLACILGKSGDIFFPKLRASEMLTFSSIAEKFLAKLGYKADKCASEDEAKQKAENLTKESKEYPVYFFKSSTSGEKKYEEFYTENDRVDLGQFEALGVINNKQIPNHKQTIEMLDNLQALFMEENINKAKIVKTIKNYIPEFNHLETGVSLDQKM